MQQLERDTVELLIQETFQNSTVQTVVYLVSVAENERQDTPVEKVVTNKFAQAEEADELFQHERRWVGQILFPIIKDLQRVARFGWQMHN